jgi:hypothetical protein
MNEPHRLRPGEQLDWDDPEWGGRVHIASAGTVDAEGSDDQ